MRNLMLGLLVTMAVIVVLVIGYDLVVQLLLERPQNAFIDALILVLLASVAVVINRDRRP